MKSGLVGFIDYTAMDIWAKKYDYTQYQYFCFNDYFQAANGSYWYKKLVIDEKVIGYILVYFERTVYWSLKEVKSTVFYIDKLIRLNHEQGCLLWQMIDYEMDKLKEIIHAS